MLPKNHAWLYGIFNHQDSGVTVLRIAHFRHFCHGTSLDWQKLAEVSDRPPCASPDALKGTPARGKKGHADEQGSDHRGSLNEQGVSKGVRHLDSLGKRVRASRQKVSTMSRGA